MNNYHGEHIWIIGASSGIGAALASELAARGATLILSARREEQLQKIADTLEGSHIVCPLDVTDYAALEDASSWIAGEVGTIDRIIFMAAIYQPGSITSIEPSFIAKMVEVNLTGALNVSRIALERLSRQPSGQLTLCASVAGYAGLPNSQPYSATKAAIINLAETLANDAPEHINIKLISPGFVRTPMTDKNDFEMPMRIEPDDAAKHIANNLTSKKFEIHFPKRFTYFVKFIASLPYWLQLPITKKFKA